MNRLVILVFFAFVLWPHGARATTCSVPNTFTNGTPADAGQVNANFSSLVSCGNAIDNTNIGSSGIYASQIKPTTALQATFGGSIGYTINPNAAAQVPLTILNAASPSADYLDVTNSGSTKLAWVDSAGSLNALVVAPSASFSGQNGPVVVAQAAAAPAAQNGNVKLTGTITGSGTITSGTSFNSSPSAAFSGYQINGSSVVISDGSGNTQIRPYGGGGTITMFSNSGMQWGTISSLFQWFGPAAATESGQSTASYLPPVYTSSGAAVASTLHGVIGSCTLSSGACTLTFSGAAIFASATSYACTESGTLAALNTVGNYGIQQGSGTSVTFTSSGSTGTAILVCFGT